MAIPGKRDLVGHHPHDAHLFCAVIEADAEAWCSSQDCLCTLQWAGQSRQSVMRDSCTAAGSVLWWMAGQTGNQSQTSPLPVKMCSFDVNPMKMWTIDKRMDGWVEQADTHSHRHTVSHTTSLPLSLYHRHTHVHMLSLTHTHTTHTETQCEDSPSPFLLGTLWTGGCAWREHTAGAAAHTARHPLHSRGASRDRAASWWGWHSGPPAAPGRCHGPAADKTQWTLASVLGRVGLGVTQEGAGPSVQQTGSLLQNAKTEQPLLVTDRRTTWWIHQPSASIHEWFITRCAETCTETQATIHHCRGWQKIWFNLSALHLPRKARSSIHLLFLLTSSFQCLNTAADASSLLCQNIFTF